MKKAIVPIVIISLIVGVILCTVIDPPKQVDKSEQPMQFGQFVEIKHEEYEGDSYMGFVTTFRQYTVYNVNTKVVYLYTVYRNGIAITPYIMRNVFGEMTVGVYNTETHEIEPMEPYLDEFGEEWVIAG